MADSSFVDPSLLDELLSDGGDRAALKPGTSGEPSARHRLILPYEIQDDPPVDVPRRLAPGDLKII